MWTGTQLAVQTTIMAVLAWVVFNFGLFTIGVALVPFFIALLLFAVALAFMILGVIMRVGHGANAMAWGVAGVVQPLSAVYTPVSILPWWAQKLALALPPAHIFEAMRSVLAHQPVPWGELWIALVLDGVYVFGAALFCRHMFATLKRRGYITRYA
jgi:ABC-2 type transport system permease protein